MAVERSILTIIQKAAEVSDYKQEALGSRLKEYYDTLVGKGLMDIPPSEVPSLPVQITYSPEEGIVKRGEEAKRLSPKEGALLEYLIKNAGKVVSKTELLENLGAGQKAEESLYVTLTRLRKKIEPDPKMPRYLVTKRGIGYIFRPSGEADKTE